MNPDFPRLGPRSAHGRGPLRLTLPRLFRKIALLLFLHSALLFGFIEAQPQVDRPPDSARAAQTSILPLPILYYTPETGIAGGAALLGLRRAAESDSTARPSSLMLDVIYTQKNQIIAEIFPEIFLDKGNYHIIGSIQFSRYPLKFYGIGNTTPDALEEPYTSRTLRLSIDALRRIAGDFSGGISLFFETRTLSELRSDGSLERGTIAGSLGGRTVGAGVVFQWDMRDNIFSPTAGRYYTVSLRKSSPRIGSDFDFTYFTLDFREYFKVAESSVFAMQAMATMTGGNVPFYLLAQLGGSNMMRGYYEGRYRDKELLAVQLEYRMPIFWRFGGAVFASVGDVAPALGQLSSHDAKTSYGLGLRYLFDATEKVNIRIDVGFGRNTSGLYFTANEAF